MQGEDVGELFAKVVNELHGHLVGKRGVEMLMWSDRLLDSRLATGYGKWEASATSSHRARSAPRAGASSWPTGTTNRRDLPQDGPARALPSIRFFQEKSFHVLPATWRTPEACAGQQLGRLAPKGRPTRCSESSSPAGPTAREVKRLAALRGEDTPASRPRRQELPRRCRAGIGRVQPPAVSHQVTRFLTAQALPCGRPLAAWACRHWAVSRVGSPRHWAVSRVGSPRHWAVAAWARPPWSR